MDALCYSAEGWCCETLFIFFLPTLYTGQMMKKSWPLGLCPDSRSCLRNCLLQRNFFGHADNSSQQEKLNLAFEHFRAFCRSVKIHCSQPRFRNYMVSGASVVMSVFFVKNCVVLWVSTTCFGSLSLEVTKIYKKSGQVLMTAKAFNGRIIAEWLQRCFQEAMTRGLRDDENLIPLVLSCLNLGNILEFFGQCVFNCFLVSSLGLWTRIDPLTSDSRTALSRFFGIQERQGRFLEPEARADVYKCGMTICRRYIDLAKHAIKYGRDEMRLRPKLHEPSLVQQYHFLAWWIFDDLGFSRYYPPIFPKPEHVRFNSLISLGKLMALWHH